MTSSGPAAPEKVYGMVYENQSLVFHFEHLDTNRPDNYTLLACTDVNIADASCDVSKIDASLSCLLETIDSPPWLVAFKVCLVGVFCVVVFVNYSFQSSPVTYTVPGGVDQYLVSEYFDASSNAGFALSANEGAQSSGFGKDWIFPCLHDGGACTTLCKFFLETCHKVYVYSHKNFIST